MNVKVFQISVIPVALFFHKIGIDWTKVYLKHILITLPFHVLLLNSTFFCGFNEINTIKKTAAILTDILIQCIICILEFHILWLTANHDCFEGGTDCSIIVVTCVSRRSIKSIPNDAITSRI